MTAKKPTATHTPLVLVRLILCCGSGVAAGWGAGGGGAPGASSGGDCWLTAVG